MRELGIDPGEAERQLELFRHPPPPVRLARPATVGDGILRLAAAERSRLARRAAEEQAGGDFVKFVPASGAASRMFKDLEAALAGEVGGEDTARLLDRLGDFAFYEDLRAALAAAGDDLEARRARREARPILEHLLTPAGGHGLAYTERPKGLVPFHRYPGERRTAFEEHLVEGVSFLRDGTGVCRLHCTVSPEHREGFERRLAAAAPAYAERYATRFEVAWSTQDHATDTLAVDPGNRPFRTDDGRLLFRPGGHGALLGNLAGVGGRVVFVKNIDNVVTDAAKPLVTAWKHALAGLLLAVRQRSRELLAALDEGRDEPALLDEAARFLAEELHRPLPAHHAAAAAAQRRSAVVAGLDRPLRVCGVVANAGEPGGGPFWVDDAGQLTLQIVEKSQVAGDDAEQQAILATATHFNPVDLVCSLADRHGRPYRLADLVDPTTVFIAEKSYQGRRLKALERPGLWNGAMAGWNTVFVEVPLATFAPVKTVFDLLRPEHQTGVPPAPP
jgi:hypothetical protein